MEEESDAFYVVRKGDIIGIYKSLSDCQAQVSSSVCDPSVGVYKGYSLPKEKEEFLACRGLKNALFTMNAVDVNDDLFGTLVPCPFHEPNGRAFLAAKATQKPASDKRSTEMINGLQPDGLAFSVDKGPHKVSGQKRSTEMVTCVNQRGIGGELDHAIGLSSKDEWDQDLTNEVLQVMEVIDEVVYARKSPSHGQLSPSPPPSPLPQELVYRLSDWCDEIDGQTDDAVGGNLPNPEAGIGSSSVSLEQSKKHFKAEHSMVGHPTHNRACILEFDGASKGNPGKAGAGAILRAEDGSVISRIRQGLGSATNNVAEYRALILGMKYALTRGFTQIRVQGDSNLVVQQVNGVWQCKHPNMAIFCKEATELKNQFVSFKISHVLREFNSDADAEANLGVGLADGQIQEECGGVH